MNRHLTSPRNELASPAASLDHHRFGGHNGVGGGVSGGVGGSGALTLAGYRSGAGGVGGRGLRDFLGGGGGGAGGMDYGTLPASLARDRRSIAVVGSHLDELSFYDADVSVNTTPDR